MKWPGINHTIPLSVVIVSQLAAKISSRRRLPRFRRIPATTMLARLQGVRRVYWMTYVAATTDRIASGHGISFSGPIALAIVTLAFGVAAWITYPATWVSDSASSEDIDASSFDARFVRARRQICFRWTYRDRLFNPCLQNSRSNFNKRKSGSRRSCSLETAGSPCWRNPRRQASLPFPFPGLVRLRRTSNYGTALLRLNLIIARCCRSFPICSRPVPRLRLYLQMAGSLAIGQISRLLATTISRPSMISRRALFTCQTG